MTRAAILGVGSIGLGVMFVLALHSPFLPNVGLHHGYYGDLNRTADRLREIPNLRILNIRGNYDVTLEDFTFDLEIDSKYSVSLYFHEAPSLSWQLFESAELVVFGVRTAPNKTAPSDRIWSFPCAPESQIETLAGSPIRNARDALLHYGSIRPILESSPSQFRADFDFAFAHEKRTFTLWEHPATK